MNDKRLAESPPAEIDYQVAVRIARFALLITQASLRRRGTVLPANALRPWEELPDRQRQAMTAGAIRIVQAMQLLGLIVPGDL